MHSMVGGEERPHLHDGARLPAERRVPCTAMVLWGIGGRGCLQGSSIILSWGRYVIKKLRLNFHLLLPFVVPYTRALSKHNFWKDKGGMGPISGAFQSTNALMTLHRCWFSCQIHLGGNGRATILPCFCHGEGEFCHFCHILSPREHHWQKQVGGRPYMPTKIVINNCNLNINNLHTRFFSWVRMNDPGCSFTANIPIKLDK